MQSEHALSPIVVLDRQAFHTRYLALRADDRALVVIKRFGVFVAEGGMPPAPGRVDLMRRALAEEIRIQGALSHPNVMPLLAAHGDGDAPFAVFPLVPLSLRDALWTPAPDGRSRAPARFSRGVAGHLLDMLLTGLAAIHAAGVVHRQLAPGALRLAADGRLLIDGFGMARDAAWDVFPPGSGGGPPGFAAPEQRADAASADPRSDLYAVGRLAYRMLGGRLPDDERKLALADIDPAVGRPLSEWVAGLLAEDPAGRPADAETARRRLAEALA